MPFRSPPPQKAFCLLLSTLLTLTAPSLSAQTDAAAAPATLEFSLRDQFGTMWTADSLSGRWTVLLLGPRRHADEMKAWSDSLHRQLAADSASVRWLMVADLRSVPRVMQRLANSRAPREAHRRLLFDPDGGVARQLKLGRDDFTVVVLAPTGEVKLRLVNSLAHRQHLDAVRHVIGKR